MTDAHGSGVEYARDDSIFTTSHDHEADHEASSARTSLLFGAKAFSRWWSVSRWKWKTVFSFHRAPGSSHAPCGEKLTQKASFFRASRDHVGTRAWFAPPNARSVRRVWREGAESVPGREFRMAPSLIRQLRGDRSDCLPIRRRVFRRGGFSPSENRTEASLVRKNRTSVRNLGTIARARFFRTPAGVRKIAIRLQKGVCP